MLMKYEIELVIGLVRLKDANRGWNNLLPSGVPSSRFSSFSVTDSGPDPLCAKLLSDFKIHI